MGNKITAEDGIIIESPPPPEATKPTVVVIYAYDEGDVYIEASPGITVVRLDFGDGFSAVGLRGEALRLARESGFEGGMNEEDAEENGYCYYDADG